MGIVAANRENSPGTAKHERTSRLWHPKEWDGNFYFLVGIRTKCCPADKIARLMLEPDRNPVDLDYRKPQKQLKPLNPIVAAICLLPGLFCWSLVLGMGEVLYRLGVPLKNDTHLAIIWILAILGLLVPMIYYLERPKPRYVWINLIVNLTGLAAIIGAVSGLFPHL
jgi:hypothetical protein